MHRIVVLIGLILALLILFVPSYLLWLTWQPPESTTALVTPNTKNTSHFPGATPAGLSQAIANALFPEGSNRIPGRTIRVPADNWQAAVAAAPLIRNPTLAAIEMTKYINESTDVGWGINTNEFGWRTNANYNFVLANQDAPEMAIAGVSR